MRSHFVAFAGILLGIGLAVAGDPVPDSELGLSRTSVFDTPVPAAFDHDGSAAPLPALSADEAPVIPHEVRTHERITIARNRCLRCHLIPEQIGQAVPEGESTPIPANHYSRLPAEGVTPQVDGGRWVCTQCHVAQADAPPLVANRALDD